MKKITLAFLAPVALIFFIACGAPAPSEPETPVVLASTTFLADIAQNVAGDRLQVESLLPAGTDAHAYQPTPADAAKLAKSSVLITNGADYEHFINGLLENAGGERQVIEASAGLTPLSSDGGHSAGDPHFWLDPTLVIQYVQNIRDGLIDADPQGAETYTANADAYIAQLQELDTWIQAQVQTLPAEKRIIVTNHENLAYFANRYGFTIAGTVIPGLSSDIAPSAKQMAALLDTIKETKAQAIFLDITDNPEIARQIAAEAHIKVVTDLTLESLTKVDGVAPTYIDMMKHNVSTLVKGCKG